MIGSLGQRCAHLARVVIIRLTIFRCIASGCRGGEAQIAPFVPLYYPAMGLALPPIAQQLEGHLAPYMVDADLIHNVRIGREGLSYASLGVARRYDIPFVLTPVHHPRWVGWPYHAYLKAYTLADRVLALTEPEKQTLISFGVQEERIEKCGRSRSDTGTRRKPSPFSRNV